MLKPKPMMVGTPLHLAAHRNSDKVVVLLLEKGSEVNAKDNGGKTPLHWAANLNADKMVPPLLEKGAEVNAKANDGKTPLKIAKENNATNVTPLSGSCGRKGVIPKAGSIELGISGNRRTVSSPDA